MGMFRTTSGPCDRVLGRRGRLDRLLIGLLRVAARVLALAAGCLGCATGRMVRGGYCAGGQQADGQKRSECIIT